MYGPDPVAHEGLAGQVSLAGFDLMLVPGTYTCEEAPSLPPRTATGQLQYQDLNPDEVSWEVVSLAGGYGLRRYMDIPKAYFVSQDDTRRTMYVEADGLDCRQEGAITLALAVQDSPTDLMYPVLWVGEFTPSGGTWANQVQLVAVTTAAIWRMSDRTNRVWTKVVDLPAAPLTAAIGVFSGSLILGYGAARTAQATADLANLTDVQDTAPASLYAWAFGADHASAFLAGGPAATDWNKVTSSVTPSTAYATTLTTCGSGQTKITSLLPGGGLYLLVVGKEDGLGEISSAGVFEVLVPFDGSFSGNCKGATWWLGRTDDEQRGPLSLIFPRQWGLWGFQPNNTTSGSAKNISPWTQPAVRPPTVRGQATALAGTAEHLYYVIRNAAGNSFLNAQEVSSGVHHTLIGLGAADVVSMTVTSLIQSANAPSLIFGHGTRVATIDLPADGESSSDNTNVTFTRFGTLTLPDMDFDFPDEVKTLYELRIVGENLSGARSISVSYAIDGGLWATLLTATEDGVTMVEFPHVLTCKKIQLRVDLSTTDDRETPILRALILRGALNLTVRRRWTLKARVPAGSLNVLGDDLQNPYTLMRTLWAYRMRGTPVAYLDRLGNAYYVKLVQIAEQETLREPDKMPESVLALQLIQISVINIGSFTWDEARPTEKDIVWDSFIWDDAASLWSYAPPGPDVWDDPDSIWS